MTVVEEYRALERQRASGLLAPTEDDEILDRMDALWSYMGEQERRQVDPDKESP